MSQRSDHLQDSGQPQEHLLWVPSAEVSLRRDELSALQLFYAERLRQAEAWRLQREAQLEEQDCQYRERLQSMEEYSATLQAEIHKQEDLLRKALAAQQAELEACSERYRQQLNKQQASAAAERQAEAERHAQELATLQAELATCDEHYRQQLKEQQASAAAERQAEAERHAQALATLQAELATCDERYRQQLQEQQASAAAERQAEAERHAQELATLQAELATCDERYRQQLQEQQASAIAERQAEAEQHAQELARLQKEIVHYRRALVGAETRVDSLQKSASFRLGNELVRALKRPSTLLHLPVNLMRLARSPRSVTRLQQPAGKLTNQPAADRSDSPTAIGKQEKLLDQLDEQYAQLGLEGTENWLREQNASSVQLAAALTRLARLVSRFAPQDALRLGRESLQLDRKPFRVRWLAFLLFDAGYIREADDLLVGLDLSDFKPAEQAKAAYLRGCRRLLDKGIAIPPCGPAQQQPASVRRLLYVASSSLPYHVSGYTTRTHALLQGLQQAGWDISCVTRPGYPADRADALVGIDGSERRIDGIVYRVLEGGDRRRQPLDEYLLQAADQIETYAREVRPALIQAASNYEAALPALIAARRLGIPFVYEVRGLWEFTAASKVTGWEGTERFALDRQLEALAASHADRVLTLTRAMAAELWERGVEAGRIGLAPNAIHPQEFQPLQRDQVLARQLGLEGAPFVVGYIGSVLGYEGLDDLIEAFAGVRATLPGARLLIVGDGDTLALLRERTEALSLQDSVLFTGRVPHTEVQRFFSLLDVIALPRKPYRVCQLVSPLKPLEAMAMSVPMVVSDVDALREMVEDGRTALVHRAGDVASLEAALLRLGQDPELRRQLATAAREHVLASRTWQVVATCITKGHLQLLASLPQAPLPAAADSQMLLPLAGRSGLDEELKAQFDERLSSIFAVGSSPAVQDWLRQQLVGCTPRVTAFCLLRAAHELLARGAEADALGLGDIALLRDAGATTLKSAARLYSNAADLQTASRLCERLEQPGITCTEADRRFISEVRGRLRLVELARQPAAPCTLQLQPKKVLNILAFSLPYTSVGYATRSHGLAQGIQHAGWEISPCTRPGFPQDFKPELADHELPGSDEIDGVRYRRIFDVKRSGSTETEYLFHAIELYEQLIREERPAVVHAASNYVTALPALIAARRLGVPFVYEVRGFWEVTRQSRDGNFSHTAKYRYMQLFEALVAQQSDRVITITTAMREELVKRGVPGSRIDIAYNSVDPQRFQPMPANEQLRESLGIPAGVPVIGYIGSFVDYEGLDDLVSAADALRQRGVDFRLLLVGDGAVSSSLAEQVAALGLQDCVIQTGRVPHEEVEHYYSLIDIAPFPRKPWEVCELVSPLKPFEAMALEKAVVVSDTRALSEIVTDGHNGLCFVKGQVDSLTVVLERLLRDAVLRRELGQRARQWIIGERSWDVAGRVCVSAYEQL